MGLKAFLFFFTLGNFFICNAQSFKVDSTFQPFFDIRDQTGAQVYDLIENKFDGRIYVAGDFEVSINQTSFDGVFCYERDGSLFNGFSFQFGPSRVDFIKQINDTLIVTSDYGNVVLRDTLGIGVGFQWRANYRSSVLCPTGIPYFFSDGSSLFANGRDNSGDPCDIGKPDSTNPGSHILKLTPEGLWDSTFNVTSTRNPRGFFRYDSSRIIVYGNPKDFKTYNGVQIDGMCRIFLDGSLDTSFHSPLIDTSSGSEAIPTLLREDGSFLIHGIFLLKDNPNYQTLAKLNADGSLDTTFMNFSGPTDTYDAIVNTVAPVEDGGYLVGGRFDTYQGVRKNCIAKIDSNGRLQPQFFTSYGPDSSKFINSYNIPFIHVIEKSKFGGYYVGGWFTSWDEKPVQPIIRLTDLDTADLVDTNTSVQEIGMLRNQINIYPNPANERLTIKTNQQIKNIQLFSSCGKIQPIKFNIISQNTSNVELSSLKPGIYFVQIAFYDNQVIRKKLVKQ